MSLRNLIFILLLIAPKNLYAALEPEVFVGGQILFNSAVTTQDSAYESETLPHGTNNENVLDKDNYFDVNSFVDLLVLGKTDSALLYGARVQLDLDAQREHLYVYDDERNQTRVDNDSTIITRKAFVFLEKKTFGRIEAGDVEGASKKLKFDASYRFGGTGGIAGNWWQYVNIPDFGLQYDDSKEDANVSVNCGTDESSDYAVNDVRCSTGKGNMAFIIRPDLPLAHGYNKVSGADKVNDTLTINRVSYYSPRISGVQFGISYGPDSGDRGSSLYGNGITSSQSGDVADVIDWGVNFVQQFDNNGIGISFTGEQGVAEDTEVTDSSKFVQQDLFAYALGAYFYTGNASFGASFGVWNDSLMLVRQDLNESDDNYRDDQATYFTVGAGYQFGAYKLGISHMSSEYREQSFSLTSVAFDYRLSKAFSLFAELNNYVFEANPADVNTSSTLSQFETIDNSGQVMLLGAKLNFGEFDSASQILLDTSQNRY